MDVSGHVLASRYIRINDKLVIGGNRFLFLYEKC
jgi:hypothetical protein